MAITIVVEVPVTVNSPEQAQAILDAVQSGLAETAIKDRVLYGGGAPIRSAEKEAESEVVLTKVETKTPTKTVKATKVEQERPRGIMGRKRPERVGR